MQTDDEQPSPRSQKESDSEEELPESDNSDKSSSVEESSLSCKIYDDPILSRISPNSTV